MPRVRSFVSRLTATLTAATLSAASVSVGLASALVPQVSEAAQPESTTTFLGVEGEGEPVSALSDALRWDLTQRGRDDGRTMTLAELKLTMGCGEADVPCFAEAGKTLGSQELVYATMTKYGDNWKINLVLLNINTGSIQKEIERVLTPAELAETKMAETAANMINELYEIEITADDIPPSVSEEGEGAEGSAEPEGREPKDSGTLIWGPYEPRPRWKKVGVGVMGGLTVAALGTAIGTGVAVRGPVRKELIAAAEASLEDNKPGNDIDPHTNGDLCVLARAEPEPGAVTNGAVTTVCNKADALATTATVSWVATGVFFVGTAVFTTLLFVHKEDPTVATLIEHDVQIGGAPLEGQGFMLGGSFRF
ncbi:hypothetical protein G6O69_13985 [Pseudenhygromyxa sp. WMMC2535]|uniref:hypothetical protein n=1 Tax=Pseudenhygromyxa sp. WMMC2535 TaxID=2712867 RepID=UPI0015550F96|nr:hypothetical protein [Pseudenhygromyxa sp. WMMC2535]NVB38947.1 hypothetical protein [Pseudenhygromyxa sp. WMMC2535]